MTPCRASSERGAVRGELLNALELYESLLAQVPRTIGCGRAWSRCARSCSRASLCTGARPSRSPRRLPRRSARRRGRSARLRRALVEAARAYRNAVAKIRATSSARALIELLKLLAERQPRAPTTARQRRSARADDARARLAASTITALRRRPTRCSARSRVAGQAAAQRLRRRLRAVLRRL